MQGDTAECDVEVELLSVDTVLYMITFSYKKQDVAVDNVNGMDIVAVSEHCDIVVYSACGEEIMVSDITGRTITHGKASSDVERISVPMPGVYVVRIGNRTVNVLVR